MAKDWEVKYYNKNSKSQKYFLKYSIIYGWLYRKNKKAKMEIFIVSLDVTNTLFSLLSSL